MYNREDLVKRGWTAAMIAKHLGRPDSVESLGRFRGKGAIEKHWWDDDRVTDAEALPEVELAKILSKVRKAWGAKTANSIARDHSEHSARMEAARGMLDVAEVMSA